MTGQQHDRICLARFPVAVNVAVKTKRAPLNEVPALTYCLRVVPRVRIELTTCGLGILLQGFAGIHRCPLPIVFGR